MSMQEGNGDSKVRVVRVGGMLFIGLDKGVMESKQLLEKPRMIQFVQMKDGAQGMTFNEVPGKTDVLEVNESMTDLAFYPTDDGFINAYRQAVTGLTLAKAMPPDMTKVVGIHGRPN